MFTLVTIFTVLAPPVSSIFYLIVGFEFGKVLHFEFQQAHPTPSCSGLTLSAHRHTGFFMLGSETGFSETSFYVTLVLEIQSLQYFSGIRLVEKFINTFVFKTLGTKPTGRKLQACSEHEYSTDAYWLCFITRNLMSSSHMVGTCKMGATSDPSAVVDPQLRLVDHINLLQNGIPI